LKERRQKEKGKGHWR